MRHVVMTVMLALATACTGQATLAYTTPTPSAALVEVQPGVYAVADNPEPVFFADNYYWRFYDGRWYRSTWYTGGWTIARPPVAVLHIDRPHRYSHYRPGTRDRVVIRDRHGHWQRR